MQAVVADASPIRYLVLIGADSYLERIYERILIPSTVAAELQAARTPPLVQAWMKTPPPWVEVVPASRPTGTQVLSASLDPGESHVLRLALQFESALILIDERVGVSEARRLGLDVIGTLGILAKCAERGWFDLRFALEELRKTNFRVHPKLIREIMEAHYGE